MRKLALSILLLISYNSFTQEMYFDFENNDFGWQQSNDSHWCIDNVSPLNGTGSLHHCFNNTTSANDIIAYAHKPLMLDSMLTSWNFSLRYAYTPSSGNNWAFWLISDASVSEMHPTGKANGYIIGVNYTGNDDLLKLWKQEKGTKTVVFKSDYNWQNEVNTDEVITLRVTRSRSGLYKVYIGNDSITNLLGEQSDHTFTTSTSFGLFYEYTSSQDMKLWLDDVYIDGFFYDDITPPGLESYKLINANQLKLVFTEPIDTSKHPVFKVNGNASISSEWQSINEVVVHYEREFSEINVLNIQNITDAYDNLTPSIKVSFNHNPTQEFDVLITELMADPNPAIELPDCEYIELYNNSNHAIDLSGWSIISGSREPCYIDEFLFAPGTYLLLVDNSNVNEFPGIPNINGLNQFPTLPNAGERITLHDASNRLIHTQAYNYSTYNDDNKKDGGWSLEMIDTQYPCLNTINWSASTSRKGGTPGAPNSVAEILTPYPQTHLTEIYSITDSSCTLIFNQELDSNSATKPEYFLFDDDVNSVTKIEYFTHPMPTVKISFSEFLSTGNKYVLTLTKEIRDCAGEGIRDEVIEIGIAQMADSGNVLINEILFEASDAVPEFIELINNSNKVIDLSNLMFCSFDDYYDTIKIVKPITDKTRLIFPGDYCVITNNRQLLSDTYTLSQTSLLIEPNSWLALPNDGGKIGLITTDSKIIDKAVFSEKMHFPLLQNTVGISLERVSLLEAGTLTKNWRSASSGANYASPLSENSQASRETTEFTYFQISSNKISPNNDGIDDYLHIDYLFEKGEFVVDVKIFSQHGHLIHHLADNELCGTEGSFSWNGLNDDNERLPMGYYVLLIEAWHSDGDVLREKKAVLLVPEKK